MKPRIVSFTTKTVSSSLLSRDYSPYLNTVTNNNGDDGGENKIAKIPSVEFISGILHELRHPLTNINLSVEILETAITEEPLKTYLNIITRNAARLNDMINELIKYQLPAEEQ